MIIVTCDRWNWLQIITDKYGDDKKGMPHHGPSDSGVQHVLMMLYDYMNNVGENAFPSQLVLAARLKMSVRSVMRHLATAEKEGWIYRFERPGRNPRAHVQHQYIATIPEKLVGLVRPPPWELEHDWKPEKRRSSAAQKSSPRHGDKISPASQAGVAPVSDMVTKKHDRATNSTPRGDKNDATGCQFVNDTVTNCHTILSSDLPTEHPSEHPSELCSSYAAAPRMGGSVGKNAKTEEPKKPTIKQVRNGVVPYQELPQEERERAASELMSRVPSQPSTWVAREYHLALEVVERLRGHAPETDGTKQNGAAH